MRDILAIVIRVYRSLLRLYPVSFRDEFKDQMLLDFSDLAEDARQKGRSSFVLFCLREMVDFPFSLLMAHYKEGHLFRVLRSQPVSMGLRGSVGFGVGFGVASIVVGLISSWFFSAFDPALQYLSVWIYDTFHSDKGTLWLWNTQSFLFSAFAGLLFGLLLAFFAGRRSKYSRYVLAGVSGWFIPTAIRSVLYDSFGWSFYLSTTQSNILILAISILVGSFWGAIFCIAESDRKESFQYFVAAIVGYPLGTYLFIKLLFYLSLEITPWFFIFLMFLVFTLLGSVIFVVILSNRKMLWMVAAGVVGYNTLGRVAFYIAYQLLHLPQFPLNTPMPSSDYAVYEISWAVSQAIFGVLLGLILGLIFGYQRKSALPQSSM